MKIVILDRDGVINQDNVNHIKNPNEWIPIPQSLEAITLLNQHGFYVVIATNQSGIGRGLFDFDNLNLIHGKMIKMLGQLGGSVDAIFYCPHTDDDKCNCRKPDIGMYEEISRRFSISLKKIPAVGDSIRDLQAYKKIGAQPILVKTGNGEETLLQKKYPKNTWIFNDLFEAAEAIIMRY
tara:strand:- start:1144 stop:1683 length:540 start_codon:yes stop_codon:yes gene_type:complete